MGTDLLSSKVAIFEEEPTVRTIDAVQTSVAAMIGVTERGPIGVPTLVTSFDEYQAIFGGFTANSDVALGAFGFFDNGGQFLYVVRTVHFTDVANAASKTSTQGTLTLQTPATSATPGSVTGSISEPFDLEPADTLVVDRDVAGTATATFTATAAARETTNSSSTPFALANADVLTVKIDGGAVQTIAFLTAEFVAIGAPTPAEIAAVINAKITGAHASVTSGGTKVTITSDKRGTGSHVEVTGGTANAGGKLNFATAVVNGTGNVANIDAVTAAEVKTIVEAAVTGVTVSSVSGRVKITSNTTGPSPMVQVTAPSTADDELGFDNAAHNGSTGAAVDTLRVDGKTDGSYANSLEIKISAATSGEAERFDLVVIDDGLNVETFPNLTMDDVDARYAETIVNAESGGSRLIAVVDLDATTALQRPNSGTFGPLAGGGDGLASLADADYIGDPAGPTGIRALDVVQDVNLLLVPGQATAAIHNAMLTYCEDTRNMSMFAILDSPPGLSATAVITYFDTTAGVLGLSEFGAAYWPRALVSNPRKAIFGNADQITVPPSGIVAGVYARTDSSTPGGVYVPPAGIEAGRLANVLGFETDEVYDERKRDLVYPKRINILTKSPGAPRFIDGSRTLKGNGNFPFVSQRRGAIFIEQSVKRGTEFARHKNNTPKLRRTVERSIRSFLIVQMKNEAFATTDPDTAFFVDFSDKLNPETESRAGRMNGRVGLAFNTPAEWVVIRFSRDTRALDAELAA